MAIPRGPKILFVGSAIVMVLIIAIDLIRPPSPAARLEALRPELRDARAASDSCRAALEREEARLLTGDARLDSLRAKISEYESLDARGVPADEYDGYIATFQAYNEGIPRREAAVDRLRANWQRCRAITERHNALADSARDLAVEAGILPADDSGDGRGGDDRTADSPGGTGTSGQSPDVP